MPKKKKSKAREKCIHIKYTTKNGTKVNYYRKVKVLSSGKYKFLKGKCSKAGKAIRKRISKKRKTKKRKR